MAQTRLDEEREPLIDPEVRAFIFSLVSALGGSSAEDSGHYILGDDALAVLKDIKRWLRLYDDKTNRLDVARLLAEANLVRGDLIEILAGWPEESPEGSFRSKVSMYAVDLLTQLTWPIEKNETELSTNHLLHIPYLQAAHANYKRAILHHDTAQILRTIVRVGLPALAAPKSERRPVEDNIIKVIIYLFRNIALIGKPPSAPTEEEDLETSRSATIDAFHRQDVFSLLLTIGSGLSEDFDTHDVEILDVIYHLIKGVDVDRLFMDGDDLQSADAKELRDLIHKEKAMLAGYARHAPSRHSRFAPMLWIKRDGNKSKTLLGQSAFTDEQATMHEMDKRKKWKKPRRPKGNRGNKEPELTPDHLHENVPLTASARRHLRAFVCNFLDSSFNPLFFGVRKAIEREANRVLQHHTRQYFYVVSWMLQAESTRRRKVARDRQRAGKEEPEAESFGSVAAVLNQETFVLLNRQMQEAADNKEWTNLMACMRCFSQILMTVQEMSESPLDEDQEISDNILARIFYEQSTHDRIITLLRTYKDQGFGYLDAVTELSHNFLRLLERYSKTNVDMQVRRIRRVRKKKSQEQQPGVEYDPNNDVQNRAQDVQQAEKISSERKFDFTRFAARFINQQSVDTFITFTRYHRDLNDEQLKRAHRFLYRVAFKMDLSVYLMRADIILLLQGMVKGTECLDMQKKVSKEWEELIRQLFRQLIKKLEKTPALTVELLFSKIGSSMFYLEHGFDREIAKKAYRAPAELEMKPGLEHADQLGVLTSLLVNDGKSNLLAWIKSVLTSAADERQAWMDEATASRSLNQVPGSESLDRQSTLLDAPEDDAETAVPSIEASAEERPSNPPSITIIPEQEEHRVSLLTDKHLRLLLRTLGFLPEETASPAAEETKKWSIPPQLSASQLREDLLLINRFEYDPPQYEDGKTPEDFVRRKLPPRATTRPSNPDGLDSDSDGGSIPSDLDGPMFPAGGPDVRPNDWTATDKPRRRRQRHKKDDLVPDSVLEERRSAKRKKELEKLTKIKSTLFISRSDDETDDERDRDFFEEEAKRRERAALGVREALRKLDDAAKSKKTSKKRKAPFEEEEEEEEENVSDGASLSGSPKRPRLDETSDDADTEMSDVDGDQQPVELAVGDLQRRRRQQQQRGHARVAQAPEDSNEDEDDDDKDDGEEEDLSTASEGGAPAANDTSDAAETPPSSQVPPSSISDHHGDGGSGSDKENVVASGASVRGKQSDSRPAQQRRRAGFIVDSDSDE